MYDRPWGFKPILPRFPIISQDIVSGSLSRKWAITPFRCILHAARLCRRSIARLAIAASHFGLISQTSSDPGIIEGMAPYPKRLRRDALIQKQFELEAVPL